MSPDSGVWWQPPADCCGRNSETWTLEMDWDYKPRVKIGINGSTGCCCCYWSAAHPRCAHTHWQAFEGIVPHGKHWRQNSANNTSLTLTPNFSWGKVNILLILMLFLLLDMILEFSKLAWNARSETISTNPNKRVLIYVTSECSMLLRGNWYWSIWRHCATRYCGLV